MRRAHALITAPFFTRHAPPRNAGVHHNKHRHHHFRPRVAHGFFPSVGIDMAERSELPAALSLSFQLDVTVLVCV